MSKSPPKDKRKRIYVNRKKHDKIYQYCKREDLLLGAVNDEMVDDFIEKHDL